MSLAVACDAPDCARMVLIGSAEHKGWVYAAVEVAVQQNCCDAMCGEHTHWQSVDGSGGRVDACSHEHLRVALFHRVAALTDEQQHVE